MHVDDFIDSPSSDAYASFVLQLTSDFARDTGYELRQGVEECSHWGPEP